MVAGLGTLPHEVHAAAKEVLRFWFQTLTPDQHFDKDPALDRLIRERFGALLDRLARGEAELWAGTPFTLLAAVIVLDQFSRNIHRGTPAAFAQDALAQGLVAKARLRGWDIALPPARRAFLYMPLMHAENPGLQALSVRLFTSLGDERQIAFARDHCRVIERFGRFPSRNAILGRCSTEEEEAYLSRPDAGW